MGEATHLSPFCDQGRSGDGRDPAHAAQCSDARRQGTRGGGLFDRLVETTDTVLVMLDLSEVVIAHQQVERLLERDRGRPGAMALGPRSDASGGTFPPLSRNLLRRCRARVRSWCAVARSRVRFRKAS